MISGKLQASILNAGLHLDASCNFHAAPQMRPDFSVPDAGQVLKHGSEMRLDDSLALELPAVDMKTDLLEWWAENYINFPALSVMARQYLGVPATSASSERLFSIAGRSFDDLRQRMKEEMLEMLMWARINREKRWASRA